MFRNTEYIPSPRQHAWRSVIALALLCLSMAIAGSLSAYAAEQNAGSANAQAAQLADSVSTKLQQAFSHLDEISKKEDLRQLFIAGDKAALAAQAETLAGEFASALKLRLLLPGQYDVEQDAKPPLGYASLDLLHKAEKSTTPLSAEIHGFGGPNAHIVLIRRVEDADHKLIGLLHLSLAPELYIQLGGAEAIKGYAELSQDTDKGALVLNVKGDTGVHKGEPVKIDIRGARWHVNYWNDSAAYAFKAPVIKLPGTDDLLSLSMLIAAVIMILAAGGYLVYRKKKNTGKERKDNEVKTAEAAAEIVYGGAIKSIMEGKHPGLEKLIPDLPRMGLSRPIQPLSQGLAGDDITMAQKSGIAAPSPRPAPPTLGAVPAKKPVAVQETTASAPAPAAPVKKTPPRVNESEIVNIMGDAAKRLESTMPLPVEPLPETTPAATQAENIPAIIFRAYDIRGIVGKTLTVNGVYEIGRAIGSEAQARGLPDLVVGRDGRASSPELAASLTRGLQATGRNVIDIGMVPTPMLYFATHHLQTGSGVMITGSHNGPVYNGLKIMLGGETLFGEAIQALRKRIETGNMHSGGQGTAQAADITAAYLRRATEDIPVALGGAFKLVVDCGNGVAGMIAPQLYRALGHDVVELYCDVDGKFPNHHPDPSQPENLQALIDKVRELQADLGFAFDGDGDRLGVVDGNGNIIWPDRQLMLFAQDVLSRNAGAPIIYDVKCSRHMKSIIEKSGGHPVMWKTGHSFIKSKMKEVGAPLAGEMSGHIFFMERWFGFDDALYAGARMLEILVKHKVKPAEVFAGLPGGVATPELRIMLAEKHHTQFMQDLRSKMDFKGAEISDIDGVRVEFRNGWGLIRPSNTSPCLVARFEADDGQSLEQIESLFRELIKTVAPDLKLPF